MEKNYFFPGSNPVTRRFSRPGTIHQQRAEGRVRGLQIQQLRAERQLIWAAGFHVDVAPGEDLRWRRHGRQEVK